jgi:hypothetical protein
VLVLQKRVPKLTAVQTAGNRKMIIALDCQVIGISEVNALPLGIAVERSVSYFMDYLAFLPEGVVLGYTILHGILSHKHIKIWG